MKYKVLLTDIAKEDIKEKKKYILRNFKYREYAEHFSRKIKKAVQDLDTLPDGMDWENIIRQWISRKH
ncbi:hypothetical protein [[Ruminococcus] torques]|uniref:hypothetical protein n=1 Tax=[Ruminococcus] torques TaxID=33039 RepID=UPI003AF0D80B